ncbi:MAG TPA: response regulator [Deltaproteobacteria bacterium]|nr:response regulator [Deltaproteobacteria bacterium]
MVKGELMDTMGYKTEEARHTGSGGSIARPHRVLIVDDNAQNLELLDALLTTSGYEVVRASNGREALERVEEDPPHIILLDVLMPVMDGYETCRRLKESEKTRFIPVVMVTALNSLEDRVRGIEAGADDFISKPFQRPELLARVKSLVRVKGLLDELENAHNVLISLAVALDFNDPYTHGHSQRVAEYAARLAAFIGLSEEEQGNIRNAGILHDIGKIATDKGVLHKPGALNDTEYDHVKQHPVVGEKICRPLKFAQPFLPAIRHHHEKHNGTGYPDGLAGEEIPLGGRIIAIVDVYDALTTVRPYRRGMPPNVAVEVMKAEAIKGFWDRRLVDAFAGLLREEGTAGRTPARAIGV